VAITFTQLRTLLAVVDQGGFTAAAEQLGMTQPAVSRAIHVLEAELGTPLLARGRDGVTLTEAGRRALGHARAALGEHDRLRADVAATAGRVTGTLRLASIPSATARLMPARLRTFTTRYPRVTVRLFEGTDQEVRRWLEQGAAEVAVVTLPTTGTRLETRPLAQDELVAVLPAGHQLAVRPSVPLAALGSEPFVLSTGGCQPLIIAAARSAGARLNLAFEARETATVLAMVAAGLGVSVVPTLSLPTEADAIVARPLDPPTPRRLGLAVRSLAEAGPAARAFLELDTDDQAPGQAGRAPNGTASTSVLAGR
jgi:DNA-binding transcriptional LysR family regulator